MKYSDEQRLQKIFDYAVKLWKFIQEEKIGKEKLLDDYHVQWLVTTPLYNIGEHAYYLSDAFKETHPETEWDLIAGVRHRLVHDYDGTNWNIIAKVVFEDLPVLIEQLEVLLKAGGIGENDEKNGSSGDSV